jgi:hypothetical protein
MANLLKRAVIETVRTLYRRGWSRRRIARELGINRETVARHLRQGESQSEPADAPTGSTPVDDAPSGSQVERLGHRFAQVASHGDILDGEAEVAASANHPTYHLPIITAFAGGSRQGKLGPEQLGLLKALKNLCEKRQFGLVFAGTGPAWNANLTPPT